MNRKRKKKNTVPSIIFITIIAIIVIVIICLTTSINKNKKSKVEEQPSITEDENEEEISFIDLIVLAYGMDNGNQVEIPINENIKDLRAMSNDESIATVSIENNKLIIKAICDEMKETTIYLTYNGIEKEITVYVKPSCLVMFDTNGGTEIIPQMVVYEGNVIRPENPSKEREKFVCWCSDEELTEEYDFNLPVISDMTLYAKYESV